MTPAEQRALLENLSDDLRSEVDAASRAIMQDIRAGSAPRDAVQAAMDAFSGQYASLLAGALSATIEQSVGTAAAEDLRVGAVTLSRRLYAESESVSAVVEGIVRNHARGFQDARRLARELFEGYDFRDLDAEPLQISAGNQALPKYLRDLLSSSSELERAIRKQIARMQVDGLSTPALRAAYNALLEALDQIEAGAGMEALEKTLKTAFFERVRFFSERIARTEIARTYAEREATIILQDPDIEYVQVRRSRTSGDPCICDLISRRDQYGLGPGVYPAKSAPNPPFHPFCKCIVSPRLDLMGKKAGNADENADAYFLSKLSQPIAARVVGSKAKLERVLSGDPALSVYNAGTDPQYRIKTLEQAANAYSSTQPR